MYHFNNQQKLADSVIVENIPKTMRERATTILNRLKTRPDVISWDGVGQVKIDGVNVPQSNISDLISDGVRQRKNFNPTGSKEFFRALLKISMPKDLVRNDERCKQALLDSSSGEEEIVYASPRRQSPSRYLPTPPKKGTKTIQSKLRWHKY